MTIDGSKLRIDTAEEERWRRRMNVTVPAEQVRAERERIVSDLSSRLKLPGFRRGRIPASVVEKRYGPALQQEMLDKVIGAAYREALQRESLRPISEGEVEDIQYEPDQDLTFEITFDVQPSIELGRLGGFAVERPAVTVTEEEVEKVVQRLREQHGVWTPRTEGTPENGDLVSVTIARIEDGEPGEPRPYELVLGEGDAIPDVEAAILTLEPGQTENFRVAFPDDFPDESRRGEEQHLRIHLEGIRARELPEADDDFARSAGDFEDMEALRARIREDLRAEGEGQVETTVRGRLLDFILEANPFEVPRSMVDRYVESVLGDTDGVDPEKVAEARTAVRPDAERAVKRILVVDRIAETQALRATEDEVDNRIETIAEKNDTSPAEVYARLQKSGRIEAIEREITERKVFEFLKSRSEITQKAVSR